MNLLTPNKALRLLRLGFAMSLRFPQRPGGRVAELRRWADMRKFVMIVAFLQAGCRRESVEMQRRIADATGTNELVLYDLVGRTPLSSRVSALRSITPDEHG